MFPGEKIPILAFIRTRACARILYMTRAHIVKEKMINGTLIFNLQQNNLCYVVKCKMPILIINDLQRKCNLYAKNIPKYLVNSQKSSTFAPDFAPNASERLKWLKCTEKP